MNSSIRSLTFIPAGKPDRVGFAAEPGDQLGEYMKNFARIIPAEAITAYTSLAAVAANMPLSGRTAVLFVGWFCLIATAVIRLLTGSDPSDPTKRQWLPAIGAAGAFALYVYAQGGNLGTRFSIPLPEQGTTDELKTWASILVGLWAAFAPIIIPALLARWRKP